MGYTPNNVTSRFWSKLTFLPIGVFFFLDDKQRSSLIFFSNIAILNLPKILYTIPINFSKELLTFKKNL